MPSEASYASILFVVLFIQAGLPLSQALPQLDALLKILVKPGTHRSYENFTQITSRNGYRSEEHEVVTEDGYILTIHRIFQARSCKGPKKEPPVILMHGLLLSSDVWLDAGPEAGLAYLLADSCHDLWVGNQRGNYYSRRHKHLNVNKDPEFWQFSVDEIGLYDIPATIDYVLDYTNSEKVNYIGFSQGCGTFYIMCSERPGYCEKVHLKISIAPATRHLNCKSLGFRKTSELVEAFQGVLEMSGIYEIFFRGGFLQSFFSTYCQFVTTSNNLCTAILAFFDAPHQNSIATKTLRVLFDHFPAGTSVQNIARYGQSMRNVDFVKFDYGVLENLKMYGRKYPPAYNLSAVTVPVVVIYGVNDGIVDAEDVKWTVNRMPNVLESYEVRDPEWNHLDNIYSKTISETIFPKILQYLEMYSNGNEESYRQDNSYFFFK